MLVLSRQINEVICIGDDVKVTIVDIRGDTVRIGVEAKKDIPIHRQEIYDLIRKEAEQQGNTDAAINTEDS